MEPAAFDGAIQQTILSATQPTLLRRKEIVRKAIMISQKADGIDVYIGFDQGVTTLNGQILPGIKGAALILRCVRDIWAIAVSGTPTVCVTEVSQ